MRIRTVKPDWWNHRIMAKLPDRVQLFAIGLLNYADDEGLFWADPVLIRNAIRPFDENTGVVTECLQELIKIKWIEIRTHPTEGQIGFIVNFKKHQRINKPTPSKIRDYWLQADSGSAPVVLRDECAGDSAQEGKGKEEEGRGKGADAPPHASNFKTAWNELPPPFPKVRDWTDARNKALKARCADSNWTAGYSEALKRMARSGFCRGKNDRTWIADVDFFLRPDTVTKILEGKYDDKKPQGQAPPPLIGQKPDAYDRVRKMQEEADRKEYLAKLSKRESEPKPIGGIPI